MIDIMTHLHQYVPAITFNKTKVISTGKNAVKKSLHPNVFQLTVANGRAAIKKIQLESNKKVSGLFPAIYDWYSL